MDEISTEDYLAMPETMARQSLDLGFAYAPAFEEAFTYVGLNFYLRPVNKQAPLRGLQFKRRFALMFGTTLTGFVLKDNERFGLFGDRMGVAGAGFRFLDCTSSASTVGGGAACGAEEGHLHNNARNLRGEPEHHLFARWHGQRPGDR